MKWTVSGKDYQFSMISAYEPKKEYDLIIKNYGITVYYNENDNSPYGSIDYIGKKSGRVGNGFMIHNNTIYTDFPVPQYVIESMYNKLL